MIAVGRRNVIFESVHLNADFLDLSLDHQVVNISFDSRLNMERSMFVTVMRHYQSIDGG